MRDYQERQMDEQTPDKVIHMCRYASQATQKVLKNIKTSLIIFETRCVYKHKCPHSNKVENDPNLDQLAYQRIGIIYNV